MPLRLNKTKILILLLLLICALIGALLKLRAIEDWLALRNYNAPTSISRLASQDTMTSYARHIFYVNHPQIDSKAIFSQKCPDNGGEKTIVLGCYHSNQAGIYLLNETDPLLNGVEQVTAAHEMLHAAYGRLSNSERTKIDNMLLDYYKHDLHNQRLLNTIAAYKKSEPNDVVNEMHSVFGTEVANLPSGLESYYKRYFTDRQIVTSYAAQYEAEFTSRQATVSADDTQLNVLKSRIDASKSDLSSEYSQITTQQNQLLTTKNNNVSQYDAEVPSYNRLVESYNYQATALESLINQYNTLVNTRNAVALQENQLSNDLSGSVKQIN